MADRPTVAFARMELVTQALFGDAQYARLDALCDVLDRRPLERFDDERAPDLLARTEILITGWGCPRLGSRLLELAPNLALVTHAAGTVRGLVTDSFWASGIPVTSSADANAVPVAEFTLGAILLAGKRTFRLQRLYRETRAWQVWDDAVPPTGNNGRVVGIVGASRIGRRVIELLAPFDMDVQVYDPYLTAADAGAWGARRAELDDLRASSDIVSLHAPSLDSTRHMIDARRLALLADGAIFINTARGELVDHDALERELVSGRLDAVIDVTDPEILPDDSPLYELPNVFLTPHIAGSNGNEVARLADLAIDDIERFIAGEPLAHQVSADHLDRIA
jgi:phosphoglycerate dehydrogenase-like enzyme